MRVNTNKTKVMISGERQMVRQKDVRWPCGVCSKGIGSNSIQCSSCQKWVHQKCSGIKGSMSKVAKSFIRRRCLNPVTSASRTSVDIGASAKLELVDKFFTARCYASAVLAMALCLSVRLSFCLSVTSRCSTKTAKRRITQTTPHDTPGSLVF